LTVACCYVSPEGVVLGADSTTTFNFGGIDHYYNFSQKLFELGEPGTGTLAVVTWGLGGLQVSSHRTLLALLSDDIKANPPTSVLDAANRWAARFWAAYSGANCPVAPLVARCRALSSKPNYDPVTPHPNGRTAAEDVEMNVLQQSLTAGFCLGGYVLPDRMPEAYVVLFDPLQGQPTPIQLALGWCFWGAPNMIQRLIFGCDDGLKASILASGKWAGTAAELDAMIGQHQLAHPIVPIRDAIDFVHSCILSTIKAFKFSSLSQICGGPVELAVITTDRPFRWVRHKDWDAALADGEG
jgi:hypothetical protein